MILCTTKSLVATIHCGHVTPNRTKNVSGGTSHSPEHRARLSWRKGCSRLVSTVGSMTPAYNSYSHSSHLALVGDERLGEEDLPFTGSPVHPGYPACTAWNEYRLSYSGSLIPVKAGCWNTNHTLLWSLPSGLHDLHRQTTNFSRRIFHTSMTRNLMLTQFHRLRPLPPSRSRFLCLTVSLEEMWLGRVITPCFTLTNGLGCRWSIRQDAETL